MPGAGTDETVRETASPLAGAPAQRRGFRAVLPFLGPAFVASIAYMDPGNFATNLDGGARYGYLLLWVVLAANLMAMLIQSLSAKLGIATGMSLPEVIRRRFPRPVSFALWVLAEIVAMATDLAEFLGAAVGFNLLLGLPLLPSALLTGVVTFAILGLQRFGFRPLEIVIAVFAGVIAVAYLIETVLGRPDFGAAAAAVLSPRLAGPDSVLLAAGILGATVMPHAIYLHSALMPNRIAAWTPEQKKRLFRFELIDIGVALGIAGLVNAAMLMMAAATFFGPGRGLPPGGDVISEAYLTLTPLLGGAASAVFALSLLASGLSSSAVGTLAGQVIMEGFVPWRIPLWLRRGVTMAPAIAIVAAGVNPTEALVLSQVVLSFGIPFALIPLVMFTRRRDIMGDLVNRRPTTVAVVLVAGLIVALNLFLLQQTFFG